MNRKPAREHAPRLTREQRVDHILNAARDLFCEKGYEATAVVEIAARIGVVEGTIYKYFASKRELLLKVLEHWYEELFGDCACELDAVDDTRGRLRLLVWRHLRAIRDQPQLCRLMFHEVRAERDYRGSALHSMNRRYTQFLLDVIADGVAAGEFRTDIPASLLRDLVYGGIEHHAWNYLCGHGEINIEQVANQITGLLCDGLTSHATSRQNLGRRIESHRLTGQRKAS